MRAILNFTLASITVVLTVAACSPLPATTTEPSVIETPTNPSTADQPTEASGAAPLPAPSVAPPPDLGPVMLQVLAPQNEAVIQDAALVQVVGAASPGAVVTINDEIILTGADGTFQSIVALEEGPNLIEVIASNESGSESAVVLIVSYEP